MAVCRIVERQTALTLSAAPAIVSAAIATHRLEVRPRTTMPNPQTSTAKTTIRPSRLAVPSQPVVNAATTAPADTAA